MTKVCTYILAICAIASLAVFVCIAVLRIRYPYELEWLEGGAVDHVARILAGEKLYVPPTADFVPFIYPPLYFYIAALVSKLTGLGFAPLRLVSFVSSLGSMLLVYLFVKRETRKGFAGLLAACLFAATYRLSGTWMDAARVDSLFLFLLLWGFYIVRFREGPGWSIVAGVLITLAFLTKQIALAAAVPVMLYTALVHRRRSIWFIGAAILLPAASLVALDSLHGGLFRFYIIDLPRQHAIVKRYVPSFWFIDLGLPLSIALVLSILYLYVQYLRGRRMQFLFYLCAACGAVGISWISKMHQGSYSNSLLPAHAAIAVLFGLGLHTAWELTRGEPLRRYPFAETLLIIAGIIQFVGLVYNPAKEVPTSRDRRAGNTLIETLSRSEGDIFIPYHTHYAAMAGKRGCAHHMAIRDVLRGGDHSQRDALVRDIEARLRNHRYGAVILDTQSWDFMDEVTEYYGEPEPLFDDDSVFYTVTGSRLRPAWIWRAETGGTMR
jgi:4-amino-4-deoxy-L-arabinose transferase-like glycosyltransferase